MDAQVAVAPRARARRRVAAALATTLAGVGLVPAVAAPGAAAAPPPVAVLAAPPLTHASALGATSAYRPVGPARLADTRTGTGFAAVDPHTVRVPVAGVQGVPADAVAVVLTVTVTDTRAGGYVSVWPTGGSRPTVSTVNADGPGQTIANGATVAVGEGGAVDVFASMPGALVIDVVGAYVPAAHATGGRFVPAAPTRLADTRPWRGPLGAGERLSVALGAAVPADARAAVVNLTVDQATGAGYWSAFGTGAPVPPASVLNTDAAGQTRAGLTVVPLAGHASIDVLAQTGGHVVVDLVGWFTGDSAPDGAAGLFVPFAPRRVIDTRSDAAPLGPGGRVRARVPGCVLAVIGNLTTTDALGAGYLSARPGRATDVAVSSLNFVADQTIANQVLVVADDGIAVDVAVSPTQVVLDLTGYFVNGPDPQADADAAADATGRFAPSVAEVSMTSVPADVIVPTSAATLSPRTNPINGRRGGAAHPLPVGPGCAVDPAQPRQCLVATLDSLGLNVAAGTGVDRERRLHQAVAVVQFDAGLPVTGMADRALYEYLGIWPGAGSFGADEVRVIGTSQQGRPLVAMRYGSGRKVTMVVGVTHGDEEAGLRVLLRAVRATRPADTTLWVVPTVNPDGLALDQRFLADGGDPNRAAPSRREQAVLLAFARTVKPRTAVYYHQNYGWIGGSGASNDAAKAYHDVVHLGTLNRSGDCANGFLWCPIDAELGSSSILVELEDVVTPAVVHAHATALASVIALP